MGSAHFSQSQDSSFKNLRMFAPMNCDSSEKSPSSAKAPSWLPASTAWTQFAWTPVQSTPSQRATRIILEESSPALRADLAAAIRPSQTARHACISDVYVGTSICTCVCPRMLHNEVLGQAGKTTWKDTQETRTDMHLKATSLAAARID